ncbi:EAL domain-containing protein [Gammaproteobacteria bacterium AB-CW1]|uniref:EAL domain-containing protein n=1 Tax=Natronospira elongata TaxID=3110268 RepID=A0AAP6JCK2_9GAMM|nr:EAL domain-containing protein [Gammaproteobacteria bacterium AB-CW1]
MLRTILQRIRESWQGEARPVRSAQPAPSKAGAESGQAANNGQAGSSQEAPRPTLPELFVGRQPIVNNRREIVAYQLLFRGDLRADAADVHDDVAATGDVLLNTLNNLGLDRVLGDAVAFIKVPPEMLEHPLLEILPTKKIILDLPAKIKVDDDILARMAELKRLGYRFAMTNFRTKDAPSGLLRQLDFIKLSTGDLSERELHSEVRSLRGHGLRLVAEKVESEEDFRRARSLFMNYYQGYFFARPETLHMRRVDPQSQRVARLFNLVLSDAPREVVETEFKQDVALSFNILRYINSPGMGLPEKVTSLRHALVMLGKTHLARWLSMMMMRHGGKNAAPRALLRTALIRGRTTEMLGINHLGSNHRDPLFMCGMFSMLDVLLGMSLEEAVRSLNLQEPISQALVDGSGPYHPYLELARACDHFDVEAIRAGSRRLGIPLRRINQIQTEAMVWARRMDEDMQEE